MGMSGVSVAYVSYVLGTSLLTYGRNMSLQRIRLLLRTEDRVVDSVAATSLMERRSTAKTLQEIWRL